MIRKVLPVRNDAAISLIFEILDVSSLKTARLTKTYQRCDRCTTSSHTNPPRSVPPAYKTLDSHSILHPSVSTPQWASQSTISTFPAPIISSGLCKRKAQMRRRLTIKVRWKDRSRKISSSSDIGILPQRDSHLDSNHSLQGDQTRAISGEGMNDTQHVPLFKASVRTILNVASKIYSLGRQILHEDMISLGIVAAVRSRLQERARSLESQS